MVAAQGTTSSGSTGTIYMTILVDITCNSLSFNLLFAQVKTSGLTSILIDLIFIELDTRDMVNKIRNGPRKIQ